MSGYSTSSDSILSPHGKLAAIGLLLALLGPGLNPGFLLQTAFSPSQSRNVASGLNPAVMVPKWFSLQDSREYQAAAHWWWADWAINATRTALDINPDYFAMTLVVPYAYRSIGGVYNSPDVMDAKYDVDVNNHLYDSGDTCLNLYGTATHGWNVSNPKFVQCMKDSIVSDEEAYLSLLGYNMTGLEAPGGGMLTPTYWGFYVPPIVKAPVESASGNWTTWVNGTRMAVNVYINQGANIHLFDAYTPITVAQAQAQFTNVVNTGTLFAAGNDGVDRVNDLYTFLNWVNANYHDRVKWFTSSELAYLYYSLLSSSYSWTYSAGVYTVSLNLNHDIYYLPLRVSGSVYSVKIDGQNYPSFVGSYIVLGSLRQGSHTVEVTVSDSGSAYPHLISQQYYHPLPTRLRSISWSNNSTLTLLVTQDRLGKSANLTFDTSGRQVMQVKVNGATSAYSLSGNNLSIPVRFNSPETVELQFTATTSGTPPTGLNTLLLAIPVLLLAATLATAIAYRRSRQKKLLERSELQNLS